MKIRRKIFLKCKQPQIEQRDWPDSFIDNNNIILDIYINPRTVSLPWPTLKVSGVQLHPTPY